MAEAAERNEPLSLMMGDIDHFKTFNDTWGHLTGDQVLRLVATLLKENFKGRDIIARYGGEEFAIVLPNTILHSACTVADQFRRAVMSKVVTNRLTGQNLGRVMMSLGVASARTDDSVESLIGRADACLYAAKRNGRNRVISETDPEFVSLEIETMVA
jgi:diguanylate cyclase